MSLSSVHSGHKLLESPFCHLELFGTHHPRHGSSSLAPVSAPTAISSKRKGKKKAKKRSSQSHTTSRAQVHPKARSQSHSKASGSSGHTQSLRPRVPAQCWGGSSMVQAQAVVKAKKGKRKKASKLPTVPIVRAQTHQPSTSFSSLARVDSDYPIPAQPKETHHNSTMHQEAWEKRRHYTRTYKGDDTFELTAGLKDSSSSTMEITSPRSCLTPPPPASATSSLSSPQNSLLTFSKMSTSAYLHNLSKQENSSPFDTSSPVDVRLNKNATAAHRRCNSAGLPPHMRLHHEGLQHRAGEISMRDIARGLGKTKYRNIIIMSGAGISTPCGLPDFR